MMTLQTIRAASVLVLTSASIAGCAGGSQAPSMGAVPPPAVTQAIPMDGQSCQTSDGVKVTPCRLRFDAKQPGPKNVDVTTGDNNRQAVRERDDCSARNVATIERMSNHRYAVTAGPVKGTCTANFLAGMRNDDQHRGSDLIVVNEL